MKAIYPLLTISVALVTGGLIVLAGSSASAAPSVKFEQVYAQIPSKLPVQISIPPDGSGRRFLVEQGGTVRILPDPGSGDGAKMFLDLTDRPIIGHEFEEGLLNLTFHPDFKTNRKFYVYHSIQNPKRSRVTEFEVRSDAPDAVDMGSERVLLEIFQPFWNHNSGNMLFGPDGYLYIAVGDGGKRDDVARLAQNMFVHNGKILRIDVNRTDGDLPYGIPEDNPFAKAEGVRPEIFALGLRNPWGIAFDEQGRLWCADVGQDLWEEINLIESGGNYGWSFREGKHEFVQRRGEAPEGLETIDPIHEYGRGDGISITGGLVYRGDAIPDLKGYYLYSDWKFGGVWALRYENGEVVENSFIREKTPGGKFQPTAFCEDVDNEILVLSWDGKIYKIVP